MGSAPIKPAMDSDSEQQEVARRLKASRTPFVTSVLVELTYCLLMTQWLAEDTTHVESPLFHIKVDLIVQVGSKAVCCRPLVH